MSRETTDLSVRDDLSGELAPTAAAAREQFGIQSAIVIAKRFPRNEDQAFASLMKACDRTSFAEDAVYSFPRGDGMVTGPSVNLAREAARVWGNIRFGLDIVRDDDESRQITGWAWDIESNTYTSAQDDFQKLIYRKEKRDKQGNIKQPAGWHKPDERDLRELTNRRGAILVRNCILSVLPKDLIEDARERAQVTLKSKVEKDPDGERKKIILAFSELNVSPEMLEKFLDHPLSQASPAQIAQLRQMYKSISDGNSTWAEYMTASTAPPAKLPTTADELKDQLKTPRSTVPPEQPEAQRDTTEAELAASVWLEGLKKGTWSAKNQKAGVVLQLETLLKNGINLSDLQAVIEEIGPKVEKLTPEQTTQLIGRLKPMVERTKQQEMFGE